MAALDHRSAPKLSSNNSEYLRASSLNTEDKRRSKLHMYAHASWFEYNVRTGSALPPDADGGRSRRAFAPTARFASRSMQMVDDHEELLSNSVARLERVRYKHERLSKILISVKAGVEHLQDKLKSTASEVGFCQKRSVTVASRRRRRKKANQSSMQSFRFTVSWDGMITSRRQLSRGRHGHFRRGILHSLSLGDLPWSVERAGGIGRKIHGLLFKPTTESHSP